MVWLRSTLQLGGILLGLACVFRPAGAQFQAPVSSAACALAVVPSAACFRQLESRRAANSKAGAPDHRYEGMAIGAGLGLIAGVYVGLAGCAQSDDTRLSATGCAIVGGLGMGILAGFFGLMIGAQFPKEEATPRDSAQQMSGDSVPK
jgi:hypothetical protein